MTNIDTLIDETYAASVDPERYDAFMDAWETYVTDQLRTEGVNHLAELENSPTFGHFSRAMDVLKKVSRINWMGGTASHLVKLCPGVAVVIDLSGQVIAANADAADLLGAREGDPLDRLSIDDHSVKRLLAWIQDAGDKASSHLFSPCLIGDDQTPSCLLATCVALPDAALDDDRAEAPRHFLLSSIDLTIDRACETALAEAFSLSQAEVEVTIALGRGQQPGDIAIHRNASIHTVRSQIKSILKKMHAAGIPDLVRTFCGFVASFSAGAAVEPIVREKIWSHPNRRVFSLTLPDKRIMSVTEQGDPKGRPILFFHNMLYGVSLTDACVETLAHRGWRVISPSRPGYGDSDPVQGVETTQLVDQAADDAVHLLASLGIEQAIVLGHSMGSVYAQRFAVRHPDQTRGVLFVSHAPYWREEFLNKLPRRQRIVALSARHAPSSLPFITSAGVALVNSGRQDLFVSALYQTIPSDQRALRRPDVHACVLEGLHHTIRQGSNAFCLDCPAPITDWSHEAVEIKAPIRILAGAGDKVVLPEYYDGYLEKAPDAELEFVEDAGQFLLYSHWPRVIEQLSQLHQQTLPAVAE